MNEITGTLNTRLRLQRRVSVADGSGGEINSWQDVDMVWAAIERARPIRQTIAARDAQTVSARILLRTRPDIMPDMRFLLGSESFFISTLFDPTGKGVLLEAHCLSAIELD